MRSPPTRYLVAPQLSFFSPISRSPSLQLAASRTDQQRWIPTDQPGTTIVQGPSVINNVVGYVAGWSVIKIAVRCVCVLQGYNKGDQDCACAIDSTGKTSNANSPRNTASERGTVLWQMDQNAGFLIFVSATPMSLTRKMLLLPSR